MIVEDFIPVVVVVVVVVGIFTWYLLSSFFLADLLAFLLPTS
jgi:hypothetical protein